MRLILCQRAVEGQCDEVDNAVMKKDFASRVSRAVDSVRGHGIKSTPGVGIVLGSGLSDLADSFGGDSIRYADVEGFATPGVAGHKGTLSVSDSVAVMAGRFHGYEGHDIDDLVLPTAVLNGLGCHTVILTNAAGSIADGLVPGSIVLIRDHINLLGFNPLKGPNDEALGPRFPDMSSIYDIALRTRIRSSADSDGRDLPEGVYAAMPGPSYETPAEIHMLRTMGASMVGMSTVPEAIVARYLGMRVIGFSTITNYGAGISDRELDHAEVVEVGRMVQSKLAGILAESVKIASSE